MDWIDAQQRAKYTISKILRRHPQDVEDCLQNAVVKALRGGFRGDSNFQTWFTRIAINEALMMLRRGQRKYLHDPLEREGEDGEMMETVPQAIELGPDSLAMLGEQIHAMHQEIRKLTPALKAEAKLFLDERGSTSDGNRKSSRFRLRRVLRERMEQRGFTCAAV